MSPEQVWLSGRFVAADSARVPAASRAVTHGVGAFETLRLRGGRAPLVDLHRARLAATCHTLGLPEPRRDFDRIISELARRNRRRDGVVRITVSDDFALVALSALPRGVARERREGIGLETLAVRWGVAALKSTSRLPLVLAEGDPPREILLRGPRGALLETSRSNLFVRTDAALLTAPAPGVLPGIARGLVVELARGLGENVRVRAPRMAELGAAREAFVTNAVRGVRPVHSIDGRRIPVRRDSLTFRLQHELDRRMAP